MTALCVVGYPKSVSGHILDNFASRLTPEMLTKIVLEKRSAPSDDQQTFWTFCDGPDWQEVIEA